MIQPPARVKQPILNIMSKVSFSLRAYLPGYLHFQHFQLVLDTAREGLEVKLILDRKIMENDIDEKYFSKFMEAGGQLFFRDPESEHPEVPPFYLIDDNKVITGYNGWAKVPLFHCRDYELLTNASSLDSFSSQFKVLKSNCYLAEEVPNNKLKIQLRTKPEQVEKNQDFELKWNIENADWVNIKPLPGIVAPQGVCTLRLDQSTEFQVTAGQGEHEISKTFFIKVSDKPWIKYKLTTRDLKYDHEFRLYETAKYPGHYTIIKGQVITLYWTSQNVEEVIIDGIGKVPPRGFQTLAPEKLSSYTITAKGNHYISRKIIVVDVIPLPSIETLHFKVPDPENLKMSIDFNPLSLPEPFSLPTQLPGIEQPLAEQKKSSDQLFKFNLTKRKHTSRPGLFSRVFKKITDGLKSLTG